MQERGNAGIRKKGNDKNINDKERKANERAL